jgi:magnesium-protoporphyrin O-methyltransferase
MVRRDIRQYRRKGPQGPTKLLLDALTAEGVAELTLLDIGGGVGAISLELLKAGVTSATAVDASPEYVAAAQDEAARQGVADRVAHTEGDFVALAPTIPEAGIVTLDRVVCCYPNMPALVGQSAAHAARLYGLVYPRDTWWTRMGASAVNLATRLARGSFRFFVYPTLAVDAVIREHGLVPRFHRNDGFWQVVVYARPA